MNTDYQSKEYHRQKSKEHYLKNKERYTARNILNRQRRRDVKQKAVDLFGGICCVCGYNKCIYALEFHHVDPSLKAFSVGPNLALCWEKVMNELNKCVLLCSNCHKEVEYGELILDDMIAKHPSGKGMQIG